MLPKPVIVPVALTGAAPVGALVLDMPLPPPQATRAAVAARRMVGINLFMMLTFGMSVVRLGASRPVVALAAVLSRSGVGLVEPRRKPYMRHDVSHKEMGRSKYRLMRHNAEDNSAER